MSDSAQNSTIETLGTAPTPQMSTLTQQRYSSDLALALRYGTALPKPKPTKLTLPAFWLGTCSDVLFSPEGSHLVVSTSNGDFLWYVNAGKKGPRLQGVRNQGNHVFSHDGKFLLVRNEVSEFALFSMPDGRLLHRFRSKQQVRLDGTGTLAGNGEVIAHLCHGGMLILIEVGSGKILFHRQLEKTGFSGEVHWLPQSQELVISQTSGGDKGTSAIWRWQWPLPDHEPIRLPGTWVYLTSALDRSQNCLLLHHRVSEGGILQWMDLIDGRIARSESCTTGISPRPAISSDQGSFAVSGGDALEITTPSGRIRLPSNAARVASFHPTSDLIAVAGEQGFVGPLPLLPTVCPMFAEISDMMTLQLRGYSRQTTLPGRQWPPRIVVWQTRTLDWLLEEERMEGRYLPVRPAHRITYADSLGVKLLNLFEHPTDLTPNSLQHRHFQIGEVIPPSPDIVRGLAVSKAIDAIELWPLKPEKTGSFRIHWYPVAALPPDVCPESLTAAVKKMIATYKSPP